MMKGFGSTLVLCLMLSPLASLAAGADHADHSVTTDAGELDASTVAKPFKSKQSYSPAAAWNYPSRVYWGDTHLHTSASMDAGAFGNRLGFEDAYRFARGEELTSSTGQRVKLSRPLDFLVISDHSDNMGFFPALFAGKPELLADPTGKRWHAMVQKGGDPRVKGRRDHRRLLAWHLRRRWCRRVPPALDRDQIIAAAEITAIPGASPRSSATSDFAGHAREQPAPRRHL
jgi:hypothetical protein